MKEDALLIFHWGILIEIADGYAHHGRRARGLQLLAKLTTEGGYELFPITHNCCRKPLTFTEAGPIRIGA